MDYGSFTFRIKVLFQSSGLLKMSKYFQPCILGVELVYLTRFFERLIVGLRLF